MESRGRILAIPQRVLNKKRPSVARVFSKVGESTGRRRTPMFHVVGGEYASADPTVKQLQRHENSGRAWCRRGMPAGPSTPTTSGSSGTLIESDGVRTRGSDCRHPERNENFTEPRCLNTGGGLRPVDW